MALLDALTPLVHWIGRASFQGAILALLILATQALLRERLAPRWRHALWLLLVARLALPWAPPSRMSIHNLIEPERQQWVKAWEKRRVIPVALATLASPESGPSDDVSETPRPVTAPVMAKAESGKSFPAPAEATARLTSQESPNAPPPAPERFPWLVALWLAGAGVCLVLTVFQTLRLHGILRRCRAITDQWALELLEACQGQMGLRAWLVVVETPEITSPVLLGFIRPRLLLPEGAIRSLAPEQLRHVFMHELAHMKRRDIPLAWLLALLQALHWFNPAVWLAFRRMHGDRELACDALVLSRLEAAEQPEYGRTILHMIERFSSSRTLPGLAGILEDKAQLKRRITMIAKFKKYSQAWSAAAGLLMIVLAGAGLTSAQPRSPYVKEQFNRPFVNDPAVIGAWESVAFVNRIEHFNPQPSTWNNELYLKGITFVEGGTTSGPWTWTNGILWHPGDRTEARYLIKEIHGIPYLFMEWMSGDVTQRGMSPRYYVMIKSSKPVVPLSESQRTMVQKALTIGFFPTQEQVAQIDVGKTKMEDAIRVFGEPLLYVWGDRTFKKDDLPEIFCMVYPHKFLAVVRKGVVSELRHHAPGYLFRGQIGVGTFQARAFRILGQPRMIMSDQVGWKAGILYKNIGGRKGNDYYALPDQGVRMFFLDGKVCGLYQTPVTAPTPQKPAINEKSQTVGSEGPRTYVKKEFGRPFVSEPAVLGRWEVVDFVHNMEYFDPDMKSWGAAFYLKELTFIEGGATSGPWGWTQGYLWHPGDRSEGQYWIRAINGKPYLFMEWISGDVTIRGEKPWYYVMKKVGGPAQTEKKEPSEKISASTPDAAGKAALQARLAAAEAALQRAKAGHEAGVIPADEYWKADLDYKTLKAEQAGAPKAAAQSRVEYAEKILDLNRKKFTVGLAGRADVLKAEAELKTAQVEVGGDPSAAARARLDYAKAAYELAKAKNQVNLIPYQEVLQAEASLKTAEAEMAISNGKEK